MRWTAGSAAQMEVLGSQLAAALNTPVPLTVVNLTGELGAGKTTWVRGFARALGVTEAVRSPTYSLVEVYESPSAVIVHMDLYRLRDSSELEPLGLREWALPGHVWLIEWPERGMGFLPDADLVLKLMAGEAAHKVEAFAESVAGQQWLAAVEKHSAAP